MSTGAAVDDSSQLLELATRNPPIVGPAEPMWSARRLMEEHEVRHLPVLDFDRVIGILSDRDVLRCPWAQDQSAPAADKPADVEWQVRHWMTSGVVFLSAEDNLRTAAERMLEHKVSGFPIVSDKGGLLAMITEADLVWYFGRRRRAGDEEGFVPVVDLMTSEVTTVTPTDPIHHAIMIFTDRRIRHLPVMEGERPVGMLSDRAVFSLLARRRAEGVSPFQAAERPISEAMTAPVIHINHLFTVMQAVRLMRQRDVHALTVLREGRLIGIFTTTEVLKLMARQH